MNRRRFLQLTSLTSLGLFLGFDALGSTSASKSIVSIGEPIIHGRHGLFNLINTVSHKGIIIQRDILTRNGLDSLSKDRMSTVKITNEKEEVLYILDNNSIDVHSEKISVIKVNKTNPYRLKPLTNNTIIFSECNSFQVNNLLIKESEGYVITSKQNHTISSLEEQFIIIYNT